MIIFLILTGVLIVSVLSIITTQRFPIEKDLRHKYGIDRDWWVPLIALCIVLGFQLVSVETATSVALENIDIIVLIFTFGMLAEGLAEAEVFEYISHKSLSYCNQNTLVLVLVLFIATSFLTLVTTNDIVILIMTPIIINIAYKSQLENVRLLLLSQFVAANTLSMGLLIGSPTNIIISKTLGIGFIDYFIYMLPIALTALVIIIVYYSSKRTSFLKSYEMQATYARPNVETPPVTRKMRVWIGIFTGFVFLITIVTEYTFSLLWCAIPTLIITLVYWNQSNSHPTMCKPLKSLPYGVLFFGLSFFIIVGGISSTPFVTEAVFPIITESVQSPSSAIVVGLFGSGFLVNVFNDLPAAVFISEYLQTIPVTNSTLKIVFIQAILAGVNIGVYVTQVGALAGIIWFNQMRVYRNRYGTKSQILQFPNRIDLLKYGILNFSIVGSALCATLFLEWALLSVL